ncbi:hypothetical protein SASPL_100075 [Salvia splendens]|uniref:Uncharacterized protein n=1 Tax=Salvia splendens TaxID=180675 RepID=A0A8X8YP36_SALSN|nr:hypothetical protein SASPL_100075 [Salvia splendens]
MERSRMLRFQSDSTHRGGCTTQRRFRPELSEPARLAPTPQPAEQPTHRSNPRSLRSGQSQSAFSQLELLLRRSASLPPPLYRLKTVDLSYNMLAGSIPASLNCLDRLYYLRLDFNRLNGSVPPLNQSSLQIFNVSHNDLTGAIPVTPALSRFNSSSFSLNSGLCGEIINKECAPIGRFSVLRRMRRLRRNASFAFQ